MTFPREELALAVRSLAANGIFVGTSSWKYGGWLGLIYTPGRYETRGKFSKARFERECLAEYAEVFKTVCFDGGFYQFPNPRLLDGIFGQVPDDFRASFKVTEDITVKTFPNLPRYSTKAGTLNERFLDAELFISAYLGPLTPYRERVGTLIFEFSRFHTEDYQHGAQFVEALDAFLARLPKGWQYSVEIRNESFLRSEYFACLRRHGVSHTFNNWSRMPSIAEQMKIPESETADFSSARFLLSPGRAYATAVSMFEPYNAIKELNPDARLALAAMLTVPEKPHRVGTKWVYVNNRLEGSAPWTIYGVLSGLLGKQENGPSQQSFQAPSDPSIL